MTTGRDRLLYAMERASRTRVVGSIDLYGAGVPAPLRPAAMQRIARSMSDLIRTELSYVRCKVFPRQMMEQCRECRIDVQSRYGGSAVVRLAPKYAAYGQIVVSCSAPEYDPDPPPGFNLWTVWSTAAFLVRLGLAAYITWDVWERVAVFERKRIAAGDPGSWLFPVVFLASWAIAFLLLGWAWRIVGWLMAGLLPVRLGRCLWPRSRFVHTVTLSMSSRLADDITEELRGHNWTKEVK